MVTIAFTENFLLCWGVCVCVNALGAWIHLVLAPTQETGNVPSVVETEARKLGLREAAGSNTWSLVVEQAPGEASGSPAYTPAVSKPCFLLPAWRLRCWGT